MTRMPGAGGRLVLRGALATGDIADVHLGGGVVRHVGPPGPVDAPVLDTRGGTILPALWDHHLHLRSIIARRHSVDISGVASRDELGQLLAHHADHPADHPADHAATGSQTWVRMVGLDDTVVGDLDAKTLDALAPTTRPIRVQHRSGHQWILNSAGVRRLRAAGAADVPDDGILWDADDRLRPAPGEPVADADLHHQAALLHRRGCVGVTDLTPTASADDLAAMAATLTGRLDLAGFGAVTDRPAPSACWGVKIILQERDLPGADELLHRIIQVRPAAVAIHTVTAESLALAVWALTHSHLDGDRLEHAFTTPRDVPAQLADLTIDTAAGRSGLRVCVNPGFLLTHGDRHARLAPAADLIDYLRLRTWHRTGLTLLGGTDAPFGPADPWRAMQSAVDRRTRGGAVLGADEALTPEEAFHLFTRPGLTSTVKRPTVAAGDPADLCVVAGQWAVLRRHLAAAQVTATIKNGRPVWIDQRLTGEESTS